MCTNAAGARHSNDERAIVIKYISQRRIKRERETETERQREGRETEKKND
jgi:hypothetical protein